MRLKIVEKIFFNYPFKCVYSRLKWLTFTDFFFKSSFHGSELTKGCADKKKLVKLCVFLGSSRSRWGSWSLITPNGDSYDAHSFKSCNRPQLKPNHSTLTPHLSQLYAIVIKCPSFPFVIKKKKNPVQHPNHHITTHNKANKVQQLFTRYKACCNWKWQVQWKSTHNMWGGAKLGGTQMTNMFWVTCFLYTFLRFYFLFMSSVKNSLL